LFWSLAREQCQYFGDFGTSNDCTTIEAVLRFEAKSISIILSWVVIWSPSGPLKSSYGDGIERPKYRWYSRF
jgi:hypothetical protein